jgi:hypothetical protein
MHPYRIAFSPLGLIYATIALVGLAITLEVALTHFFGMAWCGAD